jgi:transposase
VVACLGYSRTGAGAVIFSKSAPDMLTGIVRCLWRLGGLPRTLVWDREGALHAGAGRPTEQFAALCGRLRVGWHFCEPADPQAKGLVERLQGYMETSFEPGRSFANQIDFQDQLDGWFRHPRQRAHPPAAAPPAE